MSWKCLFLLVLSSCLVSFVCIVKGKDWERRQRTCSVNAKDCCWRTLQKLSCQVGRVVNAHCCDIGRCTRKKEFAPAPDLETRLQKSLVESSRSRCGRTQTFDFVGLVLFLCVPLVQRDTKVFSYPVSCWHYERFLINVSMFGVVLTYYNTFTG